MTKLPINQLPESEQRDFNAACNKLSLSAGDFLVGMQEEYPAHGVGPILRVTSVIRLSNRKSKQYQAGNGYAWIVAFEDDRLSHYYD